MSNILVVDDLKRDQEMLAGPFRSAHDVRCVGNLNEAGNLLDKWWPDVALVDAIFPKVRYAPPSFQAGSLLDLIEEKSTSYARRPQIIILSGQNDAAKKFEEVRSWLSDGRIADVIAKATADMGITFFEAVLRLRVENLLDRRKWRSVQNSAESAAEWFRRLGIITCSPKILALRRDLEAAARSSGCVLLTGETGTGKTLFARAIHNLTRPTKPFIHVNCATIPPALFASEVFGIQGRGHGQVYTPKEGLIDATADGILFLDEIQKLARDHQTQFNQLLQERLFYRVGGTSPIDFLGRIICATNKDLRSLVQDGEFMEDLYHRVNVFPINIPKLSERVEDIPALAESFLEGYMREQREAGNACPDMRLHPKCFDMLSAYEWKGNVRVLENVIKRAGAYAASADADEVEIGTDLLAKVEPGLATAISSGCASDRLLADTGILPGRWADLSEEAASEAISARLTERATVEFDSMLSALKPRKLGAALDSPGRDSQDPATIHCLKALLYLLLCADHRVSVQELLDLLHVKSWATGKKVMGVLAGELQAVPSFAPFLALPETGTRQVAVLLDGILARVPGSAPSRHPTDAKPGK